MNDFLYSVLFSPEYIDIYAGSLELVGYYWVSKKNRQGFLILMLGLSLWMYVSIVHQIYGILLSAAPSFLIFLRSYLKWAPQEKKEDGLPCLESA